MHKDNIYAKPRAVTGCRKCNHSLISFNFKYLSKYKKYLHDRFYNLTFKINDSCLDSPFVHILFDNLARCRHSVVTVWHFDIRELVLLEVCCCCMSCRQVWLQISYRDRGRDGNGGVEGVMTLGSVYGRPGKRKPDGN